jgi:hypothetical protein
MMNRVLALVVLQAALVWSIAVGTSLAGHWRQPTLLSRYDGYAIDNEATVPTVSRYYPRTFAAEMILPDTTRDEYQITNAGVWSGWDVFSFANRGSERGRDKAKFASFTLNRPATVALVWRGGSFVPAWLAAEGWTKATQTVSVARPVTGAQPRTYAVYTKSFPAGQFWLHAPFDTGACGALGICATPINLPYVLFAEENGQPSAAPAVPEGNEVPGANTTCPAWVHDQYVTPGPDGQIYPTWHPAIDPIYWCYFRHEHGSDPSHVFPDRSFTPFFGYVAGRMGMSENHWGHKVHAFQVQDGTGYWFLITQHFGTTGVGRANTCLQRFHLFDIQIRSADRTETLYHTQFMADYGRSTAAKANDTGGQPYTPSACPNGNADTGLITSVPSRQIPLAPFASYEPWQFSQTKYAILGMSGAMTVNTTDAIDNCLDMTCDVPNHTPKGTGTARLTTFQSFVITDPQHSANGYFCTDTMAQRLIACDAPNAVQQYIKPGFTYNAQFSSPSATGHWAGTRWGDPLHPVAGSFPEDPEGSIHETYGPN